jgi:hypothetical protein
MVLHDDFTDRDQLIEYLASQLNRGRLALVLGAGISKPFGLPKWEELLQRLFTAQGKPLPSDTPERQAEYLRLTHFSGNPRGFTDAIHQALYTGVSADFASLRGNGTLAAIASLVMASHRGSVSEVITFNFDNLLELLLTYHGFVTASVFREFHWAQSADVTIYHPHGLIPFDPVQERSEQVVFDQASYSAIVGKADSPWRQTMLTIFRRRTCLFIGLSGRDDNLDSMMQECSPQHASRSENTAYWGITFLDHDDDVAAHIWQDRGVFFNRVVDYQRDLPDFLFAICQKAASIRGAP